MAQRKVSFSAGRKAVVEGLRSPSLFSVYRDRVACSLMDGGECCCEGIPYSPFNDKPTRDKLAERILRDLFSE